ncbi:MAG: hypothetical protein HY342_09995 [Candidatus Lambdaproteobacteria bacterium]|nr:hypothetical protein [Candidatus Lambdaproteobacteria bacterium]
MALKRTPKYLPGCKVILFRRQGAAVHFGLRLAGAVAEIPVMPMPDLAELETALAEFAATNLHLREPRVHERFVGRPHEAGWLYYLVEEVHPPHETDQDILWDVLPALAPRLGQEDRKALVLAVRFLGRS